MVFVKYKNTNKIEAVSRNIAHGLIDRGEATLYIKAEKAKKKKVMSAEEKPSKKKYTYKVK